MRLLRLTAAPLGLLLALVLAGQTTDLLPCGDGDCGVWSAGLGSDAHGGDGGPPGAADAPAACFCAAAYVPPPPPPSAPVPGVPGGVLQVEQRARPPSGSGRVPSPPPRG